jgi:uncharacterized iron-regulated protein
MTRKMIVNLTLAICLALPAVATAAAAAGAANTGAVITRVSDRQRVTLSQLISAAEHSDLILIGEAHDNMLHHELQFALIRALWANKVPMAIGLEMIQADSQQALDDWTEGKLSEETFLSVYAKNWSLDWSLYRDIFMFARENRVPMVGLNIPKELVIKVSRQGYAALSAEEKKNLPQGTTCDLNNRHTAFLKSSFQEIFTHQAAKGRNFTFFCEAQNLRNSGMAKNITRYVEKHPGRKIVVLAGIWHAVKNAIPEQLEKNESKLTNTVIMPEIPELNSKNAEPDAVDYLISM